MRARLKQLSRPFSIECRHSSKVYDRERDCKRQTSTNKRPHSVSDITPKHLLSHNKRERISTIIALYAPLIIAFNQPYIFTYWGSLIYLFIYHISPDQLTPKIGLIIQIVSAEYKSIVSESW